MSPTPLNLDKTNNPALKSWLPVPVGSDFPIQNLPFGIFQTHDRTPRVATAIGDYVLDLFTLRKHGYFNGIELPDGIFNRPALNDFIALGKTCTRSVRLRLSELLSADNSELKDNEARFKALVPMADVQMLMPVQVGDYTDFYSSEQHARNVGTMFRDPDNALLPNWKHMPVGYHGRASSIVVSGTPVHRPKGQILLEGATAPVLSASQRMDFELEMAFITGHGSELGSPIPIDEAEKYIFGLVIFNDWSARDIQKWEYVPLGPFLGKSFASSISPWVVTLDALQPFRTSGAKQDPEVLDYLKYEGDGSLDINLEIFLQPEGTEAKLISQTNSKHLYWGIAQQLTHQTVNGCNINPGDMYASGTISGPTADSYGSMLELAWKGTKPLVMSDGSERKFLKDGDTVIMRAYAEKDGVRVGFGEVSGTLLPTK